MTEYTINLPKTLEGKALLAEIYGATRRLKWGYHLRAVATSSKIGVVTHDVTINPGLLKPNLMTNIDLYKDYNEIKLESRRKSSEPDVEKFKNTLYESILRSKPENPNL